MPGARADFDFVRSTGLVDMLVNDGRLIPETVVESDVLGNAATDSSCVLEHPKLPFVSYPCEWSFEALQAAALLHLDIHLLALENGVTLSDATAYNVQFQGARPVFIDSLSFRPYVDGEYWTGHRQFCDQFLNPLLLQSLLGVPFNSWYRGTLEGIDAEQMSDILPWYRKCSWGTFTNVVLQARLQNSTRARGDALSRARSRKLPLIGFRELLGSMRRQVARLRPRYRRATNWQDYAKDNSYSGDEEWAKQEFIASFISGTNPDMLWDIGCNTGDYSITAIEAGAGCVIGFDSDHKAVSAAFQRSRSKDLNFLPLVLDVSNPTPAQGWAQAERPGLQERTGADAVIALALIHHLVIGRNIPLPDAIDWLIMLAPRGVIEFVQKSDPKVQQLLQLRADLFDTYAQQSFENLLHQRARIVRQAQVSATGRHLYWYEHD